MVKRNDRSLWAVTTYFNPVRFDSRRKNYDVFRQSMELPLLTIELGYRNRFELEPDDADILLQIPGRSILWQKERLLNIALKSLPKDVRYVAWIDCDVVFLRNDWVSAAFRTLETVPIAQLFESVHDVDENDRSFNQADSDRHPTGLSIASYGSQGGSELLSLLPTEGLRQCAYGLAWAGSRSLLQRHGFYDAMILGGGDRALACAAFGRFGEFIESAHLDASRAAHYRRWAAGFFADVRGNVGCVSGSIAHLWHGHLVNRRYLTRHRDLARVGLDLESDIALDSVGCWTWASEKPELHDLVRGYFEQRYEDGAPGRSIQDVESADSQEGARSNVATNRIVGITPQ